MAKLARLGNQEERKLSQPANGTHPVFSNRLCRSHVTDTALYETYSASQRNVYV